MATPPTVTVFVEGQEFYAYHGVPAAEREVGHRYAVDVRAVVALADPAADTIDGTADYAALAQVVQETGTGRAFRTVEALADTIAQRILAQCPAVTEVAVTVAKPHPPMPVVAARAGATVTRAR